MIRKALSHRVAPAVLTITLLAPSACKSKWAEERPTADTRSNRNGHRTRSLPRPRPRPATTVAPVPPGASTQGDLLAFSVDSTAFFDWRKTPVWSDLAYIRFGLPRGNSRLTAQILKKGWAAPGAASLRKHLEAQARHLDRAAKLPPCAPLRGTWTHTELLLEHHSLFTLKMLQEALLLRARHHQHQGRPGPALDAAVAALRFACHMAHVPEVIMQLMALRAEHQALHVLGDLKMDRAGCVRLQRTLTSHVSRRAPLVHMARADWLMARSHLRMITRDLAKVRADDVQARRRLRTLKGVILGRTSARYLRYSRLVRQGLATGRTADWEEIDAFRDELNAGLAALKKEHGVSSGLALAKIVAQLPGKPTAWTADIVSRVFLGLVTMRSSLWRRARRLHLSSGKTIARLRGRKCSNRQRPSAAP